MRSGMIGSGSSVVIRTASGPSASIANPMSRIARGGASTPAMWLSAVTTASGVSGVPSWNVTPSRRVNRHESPCCSQDVASIGAGRAWSSTVVSVSATPRLCRRAPSSASKA